MTSLTTAKLEALAAIPYFASLPRRELEALARRCSVHAAARGSRIFDEGAPARGLFVVLDGRVKLLRVSAKGREQVLHTEGPGSALGEAPLFDEAGYVASAVALEDARLLFVPREAVFDLCRRRGEVALGVIRVLARRVRSFATLIEDLALRDVQARVAGLLAREARRSGASEFTLGGTRDEMAAQLGTVRELISRSLSRLQALGVIELRGRRVRVRDGRRLAEIAQHELS